MTPRESDPTGAYAGGGAAGLEDGTTDDGTTADQSRPEGDRRNSSITPGVNETERQVITSGIAQTSEIADRDAQEDAEGQGDGLPLRR